MEASRARVIAHVDLDAFYTQVEAGRNPDLKGKPLVVIQYNPFGDLFALRPEEHRIMPDSNGSIIAVSYEARRFGVKRNMMAQEAKKLCPDLNIVQVPMAHGKADLTIYRNAGAQVVQILSRKSVCERASIDEAYLDVTSEAQVLLQSTEGQPLDLPEGWERVHVAGEDSGIKTAESWWRRPDVEWQSNERLLACGAMIVASMRAAVLQELGFTCSAGVAHYKSVAKLGSGLHKPMQQTVVPAAAVAALLRPLPVSKLRQLGGKFGDDIMKGLGVQTVGELLEVPLARLEAVCGEERAAWVRRLAHGIDDEEVKPRTLPKSLGCGKTFFKDMTLKDFEAVKYWLGELGKELEERLEDDRMLHERTPRLLTVQFDMRMGPRDNRRGTSVSRSGPLQKPLGASMAQLAFSMLKMAIGSDRKGWGITGMQLMAGNFAAAPTGASTITRFLSKAPTAPASPSNGASVSRTVDDAAATPHRQSSTAPSMATSPASTSTASPYQSGLLPTLGSRTDHDRIHQSPVQPEMSDIQMPEDATCGMNGSGLMRAPGLSQQRPDMAWGPGHATVAGGTTVLPVQHHLSATASPTQRHLSSTVRPTQHHLSAAASPAQHQVRTTVPPPQPHPSTTVPLTQHHPSTTVLPTQHHVSTTVPPTRHHPSTTVSPAQPHLSTTVLSTHHQVSTTVPATQHQVSTTVPATQHQVSTTVPPTQHQVSTTVPPTQHQVSTTVPPTQYHPSTTVLPTQHHLSTTASSTQRHLSTMISPTEHHLCTTLSPTQHHPSNIVSHGQHNAADCSARALTEPVGASTHETGQQTRTLTTCASVPMEPPVPETGQQTGTSTTPAAIHMERAPGTYVGHALPASTLGTSSMRAPEVEYTAGVLSSHQQANIMSGSNRCGPSEDQGGEEGEVAGECSGDATGYGASIVNASARVQSRWMALRPDDVDASVLEELPEDIRKEVEQMLGGGQQAVHQSSTSAGMKAGAATKQVAGNKRRKLGGGKPGAGQRGITQYFKR